LSRFTGLVGAVVSKACQERHCGSAPAPGFAEVLADGLPLVMRQRIVAETRGRPPLSAISVMEQRLSLGERLLHDNDVASKASSLEQSA
jgi:asparagine synthase (glutamine-hydrolysing)